jgi:hypothetical protein
LSLAQDQKGALYDRAISSLRAMIDTYWRGSEDSSDENAPTMVREALGVLAEHDAVHREH